MFGCTEYIKLLLYYTLTQCECVFFNYRIASVEKRARAAPKHLSCCELHNGSGANPPESQFLISFPRLFSS